MKKYHLKKSMRRLQSVSLSPEERADVRIAIASLVTAVPTVPARRGIDWHWNVAAATLAGFAVVTFVGAGASFAAEGTLPGDILYPIKISITEPLRATLASTPEARADWEVERAERRLIEAEQLAAQARLSKATEEQLSEAVTEHARQADTLADSLEDSGEHEHASVVRSRLEALLNVHSEATADAVESESEPERKENKKTFAESVNREAKEARAARSRAEDSLTNKAPDRIESAATNARTSARTAIEQASTFINQQRNKIDSDAFKKAEEHLSEAEKLFDEAGEKFSEKNFGDAFKKYTAALRASHEAQVIASTSLRVKFDRKQKSDSAESNRNSNENSQQQNTNNDDRSDERRQESSRDRVATSSIEINVNTELELEKD